MRTSTTALRTTDADLDRICFVQRPPQPDWFVCIRNETGQEEWFLKFTVTGLFPRLYGPFSNRHQALLCLDWILNELLDGVITVENAIDNIEDGAERFFPTPWHRTAEAENSNGTRHTAQKGR